MGKSEVATAKAQIDALSKALDAFRLDTGAYPTSEQGLLALVDKSVGAGIRGWQGPYLQRALPLDPWGRAYVYKVPPEKGMEYDLLTYGKDGQPGGVGADQDIGNW